MKLTAGALGDRVRADAGRAWLAFPGRVRRVLQRDYLELLIVVLAWAAPADAALEQLSDHTALVPISLLYSAPLLLRRRLPLAAPALISVGFVASSLISAGAFETLNLPFLCAIVAMVFVGSFAAAVRQLALPRQPLRRLRLPRDRLRRRLARRARARDAHAADPRAAGQGA